MMKIKRALFLAFILVGCAAGDSGAAAPARPAPADPMAGLGIATRPWPGRMSPAERAPLEREADAMVAAMNHGDRAAVLRHRDALVAAMGGYLGEPEVEPRYGRPIDTSQPYRTEVLALWNGQEQFRTDALPWHRGIAAVRAGVAPPRLRETTRVARAELLIDSSRAPRDPKRLQRVIAAADYLLAQQGPNGVFGYPYDPRPSSGPRDEARRLAEAARARGQEIVANGWLIDDLGNGGLNFDNAQAGLFLIHVYLVTGDERYLAAAKRAGEWARTRPFVANFNYNGFNGQLLARLYRVTREPAYLTRAKEVFELSVLPGQLPNGRWFDQHNARIQYHAILLSQMIEHYLALDLAGDSAAGDVRNAIEHGLDNMATEITTYGPSNAHELLAVDALVTGSRVFGERPRWREAINVDINFLADQFAPKLAERGFGLPEPVGVYLLDTFGTREGAIDVDGARGSLALRPE